MSFSLSDGRNSLIVYLLIALFIRFPFFFRDYIDRDESTFILMGQSWADGFLPYTQLWDLKPPLVFLFFSLIIELFGKSYIAIRLFGTLVIVFTAYFINLIGRKGTNGLQGFFAGLLYVYLSGLFGSVQGVMSEHLAMFFFVAGFWYLLDARTNMRLFIAAVLFGTALMFRLNLIYPTGMLFLYVLFSSGFSWRELLIKGGISVAGGLLASVLTFLPYLQAGIPGVWWNSVVLASLNYDNATFNEMMEALGQLAAFLVVYFLSIFARDRLQVFEKRPQKLMLIWIAGAGLFFMLVKSGKVNTHYLIQLYPFIILLLVPLLGSLRRFSFEKMKGALFILFLVLPVEAYLEYSKIGFRLSKGLSPYNGKGFKVPEFIDRNYPDEVTVFFLDYHIGYWELDKLPPTKMVTHPSNLLRPSNYPFVEGAQSSPLAELEYIMQEVQPQLIISRSKHISFEEKKSEENRFFKACLAEYYDLVLEEPKLYIYERKADPELCFAVGQLKADDS